MPDTFVVRCDCGTEFEVTLVSSLDSNTIHCVGCGEFITVHKSSKTSGPTPQHDTTPSPAPQYGITEFRGGDYS